MKSWYIYCLVILIDFQDVAMPLLRARVVCHEDIIIAASAVSHYGVNGEREMQLFAP